VDELMDDLEDEKDLQDQIGEAISRNAVDMDDEDLLAELEELEELQLQEDMLEMPNVIKRRERGYHHILFFYLYWIGW